MFQVHLSSSALLPASDVCIADFQRRNRGEKLGFGKLMINLLFGFLTKPTFWDLLQVWLCFSQKSVFED